jgi:hypothetical protein
MTICEISLDEVMGGEEKEGNELGKAIVCRLLWRSIWRLCVGERSKRDDLSVQS